MITRLIAASAVLLVGHIGAEESTEGTALVDYFGYSECIALENDSARVVITGFGGRILEYAWKGKNALYLDPEQAGVTYTPGAQYFEATGGRFDIGPEHTIPRHLDLWLGPWQGEITGPRSARMTSMANPATGVQLVRDFVLDPVSSHLRVTQTIRNISDADQHWCHWSRTFAPGGGIVLIPLTDNSRFPHKYIMYGPGPVMDYRPEDPNIRERNGFLEILGPPQRPKLGMDSYAGWFAYLDRSDLLFVKRYPVYPDRVYSEMAGLTLSIWYYEDQMCELEPIGPREDIAPGRSASFAEDWWLLPFSFPAAGGEVDLEEVSQLVAESAR